MRTAAMPVAHHLPGLRSRAVGCGRSAIALAARLCRFLRRVGGSSSILHSLSVYSLQPYRLVSPRHVPSKIPVIFSALERRALATF